MDKKRKDITTANTFSVLGSLFSASGVLLLTRIGHKLMKSYFYLPFVLSILGLCCFGISFYYFLRKKK